MTNMHQIDYSNVLSDLRFKRKELDKAIDSIECLIENGVLSQSMQKSVELPLFKQAPALVPIVPINIDTNVKSAGNRGHASADIFKVLREHPQGLSTSKVTQLLDNKYSIKTVFANLKKQTEDGQIIKYGERGDFKYKIKGE